MAQLELFPRSQVASWRDRTTSRNYSPEAEEFRREHERHREWGLRQRHGRRAMYLRLYGDIVAPADRISSSRTSEPSAPVAEPALVSEPADADRLPVQASSGNVAYCRGLTRARVTEGGEVDLADETAPPGTTASADHSLSGGRAASAERAASAGQAGPAVQTAYADRAESAGQAACADRADPADRVERCERADCAVPNQAGLVGRCRRADGVTPSIRWLRRSGRTRRSGQASPPARPCRLGRAIPSAPTGDRAPPAAPPAWGHGLAGIDQNHPRPWWRDEPLHPASMVECTRPCLRKAWRQRAFIGPESYGLCHQRASIGNQVVSALGAALLRPCVSNQPFCGPAFAKVDV
jgi:hypothetical protein